MTRSRRRILFVTGFFPPNAPMGAVRVGKLEQYWRTRECDVRVLALDLPAPSRREETAGATVFRIPVALPQKTPQAHKAARRRASEPRPRQAAEEASQPKAGLADLYRDILFFPDRYRSWVKPAVRLALSWAGAWRPDVIYSSGPPHSGHLVAARLCARLGVPWIAELRDLWLGNPYEDVHPLIRPLHAVVAKRALRRAQAYVVVTRGARTRMQAIADRPAVVAYNGFDPADFAGLECVEPLDPERLTIVHAGSIYAGRRDPAPLFAAMRALSDKCALVRCIFFHDSWGSIAALTRRHGLAHCVEIRDPVPRTDILRLERQADILLECHWRDPAGDGVIPGKLFEYIGARRPILSLGSVTAEAAEIVRSNHLGLAANEPEEIRAMLLQSLEAKARHKRLPDLAPLAKDAFCFEAQFQKIDGLFETILRADANN